MNPFQSLLTEFRAIGPDYKAEVLAAEIGSNRQLDCEVYFKAASTFRRSVARDVAGIEWEEGADGRDRLFFIVNREGIYDMIPQGVTHYNPGKEAREHAAFVEDIKYQRGLEAQARKFFLPIENEFYHQRLKLERVEREFDNCRNADRNREMFDALFGDSTDFDDLQLLTLLYLLPLAHRIRGDVALISFCMSRILGYKVTVTKQWEASQCPVPDDLPGLDEMTLGMDSILAGTYTAVLPHYHLAINGIEGDGYRRFMEGGQGHRILQRLIAWFLPVHTQLRLHLNPGEGQEVWTLGDETKISFMGYNTCV